MLNTEIDAVVCLWEWNARTKSWKLEDTYGCDGDSHPCTPAKYADAHDRHGGYYDWLFEEDGSSIPGRAVTCWSAEYGVTLEEFTPPSQVDWIDWYDFKKTIRKNWVGSLVGAYEMKVQTASEALKLIQKESNE